MTSKTIWVEIFCGSLGAASCCAGRYCAGTKIDGGYLEVRSEGEASLATGARDNEDGSPMSKEA